ncbi:hypothetical protein Tco_0243427 [Tanacetum coccineum]
MIIMRDDIPEEDMPPRKRFVLTDPPPRCDVAESSAPAAARLPRAADRARDVGYVRALRAFEHKMMTSIEEVNLRVSYQAQVHRALLAQLETLETHMSRMEWQRQSAEDRVVRQMMHTQTEKVDKYISGLPDNIHGNVMSARPKTLNDTIELANDLMDQKLRTYAERAYTAGPGEKKVYTRNLPLCTKFNYHHTGQCAPKCGNCKRYGHTTNNCQKNCPKLKNHGNGNKNGIAQGRAYALGGRDASPDSNIITGTFLFNNRYAIILFDTGADRSFVSTTFSALIDITTYNFKKFLRVDICR